MAEKMTKEQLATLAQNEFENAQGHDGGEISQDRAKAMNYYLQKLFGDEEDDQMSTVVTSDVADVVDGIMPSLMRIFMSGDTLCKFDPQGEEDVERSAQETDVVHYAFFKKNPAFLILFYWFFDALLQKNGYAKCWWDERRTVTQESYENLDAYALAKLLQDEELEPVEREERIEVREVEVPTPRGMVSEEVEVALYDVTFKRTKKYGCPKVDVVPPEELRISRDSRSLDPTGARMIGHERPVTRSELIEMGFDEDLVMLLPTDDQQTTDSREKLARRDKTDEQNEGAQHSDRSQETVRLREIWMYADYDGDGVSELRHIFMVGAEVLDEPEIADRQPFHALSPMPLPHKHFGRGVAEKAMDLQRINSTLVRQILDNLYHTNNPGHAVWELGLGEHTLNDLLTTRAGAVRRFRRPISESYQPMTVPFTAGASFPMLEYFDKVKKDRTGVGSDAEGLSPEQLKHVQQSVMASSMDLSKMKVELIARIFAETGIKSLFLHIHELLQKHQDKEQVIELRGKYVPVDPSAWRTRYDMTAQVGLGAGSRETNLLHLESIWQKVERVVDSGGMEIGMVTPGNVYELFAEFCRNAGYKDASKFMTRVEEMPQRQGQGDQAMAAQLQLAQQQLQLEAGKLEQSQQKMLLEFQSKQAEREEKAREREDRMTVEMEKLANQITELELKYNRDVPGSRV